MAKKFKRWFSVTLIFFLIMGISDKTYAGENESTVNYTQVFNEYDYILTLEQSNSEELSALGLTQAEADIIISSFKEALAERMQLSEYELLALGYTDEEIDLLKSYSKGARGSENSIRAITGTCTGNITVTSCGTKYAVFSYIWTWDHSPIMTFSDSAAMRWLAYDVNGYNFNVIKADVATNIDYYNGSVKQFSRKGTQEPGLEFNTVNLQFPMTETYQTSTTITESAYAKSGIITVAVQVDSSVNNNINYIMVAGLYGHTTLGNSAPSVSLSPTGSVSISFSGKSVVDKIAGIQAKIGTGSTITYIE